ncbi:MAG: hypothetical protein KJI69_04450 [Patescibacteria group bacterium]|nr:hypothetical protein [Patescibacteria group bacterium]
MNTSCNKIIDVREKEIHLKVFHPNYISLVRTTKNYPDLNRFMTPKQIIQSVFEVVTN